MGWAVLVWPAVEECHSHLVATVEGHLTRMVTAVVVLAVAGLDSVSVLQVALVGEAGAVTAAQVRVWEVEDLAVEAMAAWAGRGLEIPRRALACCSPSPCESFRNYGWEVYQQYW